MWTWQKTSWSQNTSVFDDKERNVLREPPSDDMADTTHWPRTGHNIFCFLFFVPRPILHPKGLRQDYLINQLILSPLIGLWQDYLINHEINIGGMCLNIQYSVLILINVADKVAAAGSESHQVSEQKPINVGPWYRVTIATYPASIQMLTCTQTVLMLPIQSFLSFCNARTFLLTWHVLWAVVFLHPVSMLH